MKSLRSFRYGARLSYRLCFGCVLSTIGHHNASSLSKFQVLNYHFIRVMSRPIHA